MNKKIIVSIIFTVMLGIFLFSLTSAGQNIIASTKLVFATPLTPEADAVALDKGIDNIQVSQGACDLTQCKYHAYKVGVVDSDFYIPTQHDVIDDKLTSQAQQDYLDNNKLDLKTLTKEEQDTYDKIQVMQTVDYTDNEIEQMKNDKVADYFQQAISYYADRIKGVNKVPDKTQGQDMVFSK